jgi:hypothetical protein
VIFLLACGGCSGAGEEPPYEERPTLTAEELVRIGSLDDPETSLTSFFVLDRSGDGRIYTLHSQENLVRIHSPEGRPVGRFGGEGQGPGEFTAARDLGIDGDEVWVLDGSGGRVSYFSLEGEFLRDETFRPRAPEAEEGMMAPPPIPIGRMPDGTILTVVFVFDPNRPNERPDLPVVQIALDGTVIDTVGIQPAGEEGIDLETVQGSTFRGPQPFPQEPLLQFWHSRGEVLKVERAVREDVRSFRVVKSSFAGDTIFDRTYGFNEVPITPAIVDSMIDQLARQLEQPGFLAAGELRSRLRDGAVVPPHMPPVRQVRAGADGTTWLALEEANPVTTAWLVLLPDGEPLGEVRLPRRFLPLMATRDEAWGAEFDEFDVPYIVGYVIRGDATSN